MKQISALFFFLIGLACVARCGVGEPAPEETAVYGLTDLVVDLQDKRAIVTVDPQPTDDLFQVPGKRIAVDGASIAVYEYADHRAMERAAGGISAGRGSITVTRLAQDGSQVRIHADCIGTPYLYKKGTLIVLIYDHDPVYEHARARRWLRSILGPHFAGGEWALAHN